MLVRVLLLALAAAAATCASTSGSNDNVEYLDPHCEGRQVIVQLFEWKWTDVARECEDYLGPHNFCGVQVSPPNEHALVSDPIAPWWQRYQPISYKMQSRSGSEDQFLDMVKRCLAAGVRIYVDAVFNNMAAVGLWGTGTAGSTYDSDFRNFPGVPYGMSDFHDTSTCHSVDTFVNNYNDPDEVRNCSYLGRTDLDQAQDNVRNKVSDYLNYLTKLGVAGFRIDLAKFMWPRDLSDIQNGLTDLPEGGRPFIYHHVEDYGDDAIKTSEYTQLGYVTNFQYGRSLAEAMAQGLQNLHRIQGPIHDAVPARHALVFVDNHETQRKTQVGSQQLSFKDPKLYTMATAFTLAYNYGFVRLMSSYNFTNADSGPPSGAADQSTEDVTILADGSCGEGWICEHRWPAIAHMVHFRNKVNGTDLRHWTDGSEFVAFSRGDVGFFAMTTSQTYVGNVRTALPPGRYCELLSQCQRIVEVDDRGSAHLNMEEDINPIVAVLSDWPAPDNAATGNVTWGSSLTPSSLPQSSGTDLNAWPSAVASWSTPGLTYATADLNINPSPTSFSGPTSLHGYDDSALPILPTRTLPPTSQSHHPSVQPQYAGFQHPDLRSSAQSYHQGGQSYYPDSWSEYPATESYYSQHPSHYPHLQSSGKYHYPGEHSYYPDVSSHYQGFQSYYPEFQTSSQYYYPYEHSYYPSVNSHYPGFQTSSQYNYPYEHSYYSGVNSNYPEFQSSSQYYYPYEHSYYSGVNSNYPEFQSSSQYYYSYEHSYYPSVNSHNPAFQSYYPEYQSSTQHHYPEHSYHPGVNSHYPGFQSYYPEFQSSSQYHYPGEHSNHPGVNSHYPGFQSYYPEFQSSSQYHYPGEHSNHPGVNSHYPGFQSYYPEFQSSSQYHYPGEHSNHPGVNSHYPGFQSYYPEFQSSSQYHYPGEHSNHPGVNSHYPGFQSYYPEFQSSSQYHYPGEHSNHPGVNSHYPGFQSYYPEFQSSSQYHYPGEHSNHPGVNSHYPGFQSYYPEFQSSSQYHYPGEHSNHPGVNSHYPGFQSYYPEFQSSSQYHYPGEHSNHPGVNSHYPGFQSYYPEFQSSSQYHYPGEHSNHPGVNSHYPGFQSYYPEFQSSSQYHYPGEHSNHPGVNSHYPGFQSYYPEFQSSSQYHYPGEHSNHPGVNSHYPGFQSYYPEFQSSSQYHYPGEHSYSPGNSHYPGFQSSTQYHYPYTHSYYPSFYSSSFPESTDSFNHGYSRSSYVMSVTSTHSFSVEPSPTLPMETATTSPTLASASTTTTQPTTTALPSTTESPYKRTVILLHWVSRPGEYIFFRGGIDKNYREGCRGHSTAASDPCAIPIRDRDEGSITHLNEYNAWRVGDNFLDWYGAEPGQGTFHSSNALGSPGIWTTNIEGAPGYSVFNRVGDHYWLLDVDMDCSQTDNGYFEIKGYSTRSAWEHITAGQTCSGEGSYPPHPDHGSATNHFAHCGYVNVFKQGGGCEINSMDNYLQPDLVPIG